MGANNSCEISRLPEDCLSRIISLTSPRDACRCSAVSSSFKSAAAADMVWSHFLPADLDNILSNTLDRPFFPSKRDLYFHLSNHGILVDDGKMSFSMDRPTAAKIYMLSARAVLIAWGDNPQYWQRVPHPGSRFSEVAQLILVWWLDIGTTFSCRHLSPKTRYAAYFIFKLEADSNGFDIPIDASIVYEKQEEQLKICLQPRNATTRQNVDDLIRYPKVRDDQWSEVEIGEFFYDGEDEHVRVKVDEKKDLWAKRGLIFCCFEFRPKI
ncbi:hypothetical protein LUZ63_005384 [Rhynchospora breviuscula]|uniref:F-box domain-containing protein n=1 Tax=Rhynchospora breviuscula TaxID=2022672 RepID=A0A9Q0CMS8_9POAL|nr:hypothetical protein LUZ63_005384 [Rhynchospora breviuscula]